MTSEELFDVATSGVERRGVAGSFGYESDYYEVSVAAGEGLAEQFATDDAENRTVVASGAPWPDQLDRLLDRRNTHRFGCSRGVVARGRFTRARAVSPVTPTDRSTRKWNYFSI